MRLSLDDGYTLHAETSPSHTEGERQWDNLPTIAYDYRPALPDAIYEWQAAGIRAITGKEQVDATAKILADHITAWDVTKNGASSPITPDTVRKVPYPILQQLVRRVTTWAPKEQDKAAGN